MDRGRVIWMLVIVFLGALAPAAQADDACSDRWDRASHGLCESPAKVEIRRHATWQALESMFGLLASSEGHRFVIGAVFGGGFAVYNDVSGAGQMLFGGGAAWGWRPRLDRVMFARGALRGDLLGLGDEDGERTGIGTGTHRVRARVGVGGLEAGAFGAVGELELRAHHSNHAPAGITPVRVPDTGFTDIDLRVGGGPRVMLFDGLALVIPISYRLGVLDLGGRFAPLQGQTSHGVRGAIGLQPYTDWWIDGDLEFLHFEWSRVEARCSVGACPGRLQEVRFPDIATTTTAGPFLVERSGPIERFEIGLGLSNFLASFDDAAISASADIGAQLLDDPSNQRTIEGVTGGFEVEGRFHDREGGQGRFGGFVQSEITPTADGRRFVNDFQFGITGEYMFTDPTVGGQARVMMQFLDDAEDGGGESLVRLQGALEVYYDILWRVRVGLRLEGELGRPDGGQLSPDPWSAAAESSRDLNIRGDIFLRYDLPL